MLTKQFSCVLVVFTICLCIMHKFNHHYLAIPSNGNEIQKLIKNHLTFGKSCVIIYLNKNRFFAVFRNRPSLPSSVADCDFYAYSQETKFSSFFCFINTSLPAETLG